MNTMTNNTLTTREKCRRAFWIILALVYGGWAIGQGYYHNLLFSGLALLWAFARDCKEEDAQ